ncbi:hypothetical protein [Enterococcus sp.]|uniref:hypothetical protein n=1 Tax=Enterococcus sp. TaxID=35783 RepID=UPI003C7757A9
MLDQQQAIDDFLEALSIEEKRALFNDLLAVEEVYQQNCTTSFYTFRKIRRASKRHVECRKRTLQYRNQHNDELVITQVHEQHLFKNLYHFKVFFNLEERDFTFVEVLLQRLREGHFHYYIEQNAYA